MSKRFAMKRYLGLDEAEIYQNEKLWAEENANVTGPAPQGDDMAGGGPLGGLSDVGAAPMPMAEPDAEADVTAPDLAGETSPTPGGGTTPEEPA